MIPPPQSSTAPSGPPRTAASQLRPFFEPRTVAVIGASRRRGQIGAEIFHNLLACGFLGRAVPVNPNATTVAGVPAYHSITEVPDSVDLAVVAVPTACVDDVVDECLAKQVPAIVVISAGFGETGDEGRAREVALRTRVKAAGARLIGPNCMGVVNTNPAVRLNATFSASAPPAGRIALASQSGALGLAILDCAGRLGLGTSSFVSLGNTADVTIGDLLDFWKDDPATDVIALYIESFVSARQLLHSAERVSPAKPIVALKAGRSQAGVRAAVSHTGALAAADSLADALFQRCGIIRADTLEELFDVATLLAQQPVPRGSRVAILTNAGGPGILAADVCEARGLTVPSLSPAAMTALREFLPRAAGLSNPIDMLASASAEDYARAMPVLLRAPEVDALIAICIPLPVSDADGIARAISNGARNALKPVVATFLGADVSVPGVPCYRFPEGAARALAKGAAYGRWRASPRGAIPALSGVNRAAAREIVEHATASSTGWLSAMDAVALLAACAVPLVTTVPVTSGAEAVQAAGRLGYPVALKGTGPHVVHKTEAHALHLALNDEPSVLAAYQDLAKRTDVTSIVLQPMIRDGVEFLVGATLDPVFGHVLICGTGGTLVELLRDTTSRLHPLTDRDAGEMVDGLRGAALLRGFRGAPMRNEAALRDVLLRVSALIEICPEVVEIDLNPVMVTADEVRAVDVRVRLRGAEPEGVRA